MTKEQKEMKIWIWEIIRDSGSETPQEIVGFLHQNFWVFDDFDICLNPLSSMERIELIIMVCGDCFLFRQGESFLPFCDNIMNKVGLISDEQFKWFQNAVWNYSVNDCWIFDN